MVIRDKQELKRCVKQTVRRALVTETALDFDVMTGNMGVSELLQTWASPAGAPNDALRRACAQQTPFSEGARTMFSALSALELPTHNLNNAETIAQSYDRSAYLREVLDAMHASRVFVRVDAQDAASIILDDDRLSPMLDVEAARFFVPGRYGVCYEEEAAKIAQLLLSCGARDLSADADFDAIRYCLIPLSEDTGCVLHLRVASDGEASALAALLAEHPKARAVVSADPVCERALIQSAQDVPNLLVRLSGFEQMRFALETLGTRFVPFASHATLPEQMLGRWVNAREAIWQTLFDAYLPLARSGYELTSDAIERDVSQLLGGNLAALYREE